MAARPGPALRPRGHAEVLTPGYPAAASRPYGALGYLVGLMRLHGLARLYFERARAGRDGTLGGAGVRNGVGSHRIRD